MIKQQKIDNYYEKQRILQIKREQMEKINKIKKKKDKIKMKKKNKK